MLLDRRRIRKWAKWVALLLAVVFALSFLLLGVGYGGGAGLNIFDLFKKNDSTATTLSQDQRINSLLTTLAQNPKDINTMQEIATAYLDENDPTNAAKYLEQVIAVDPTQKDVYLRLADLYMNTLSPPSYTAAVAVLNKAQAVDPDNPDVYLQLGLAQRSLGNTSAAILAWQKYLSLAPNGVQADTIRSAIATLSAQATTTTTAATTTTTAATTSTTAASTSSTAGSTTTSALTTSTTAASTSSTASTTTTAP